MSYLGLDTGSIDPWFDTSAGVGFQSDGTFSVPVSAEPTNNPANTAGYPSVTDAGSLDILKWGPQLAQNLLSWDLQKTAIDKRYEATNGGLFMNGRPAMYGTRTAYGTASPGMLLALVGLGAFLLLMPKKG